MEEKEDEEEEEDKKKEVKKQQETEKGAGRNSMSSRRTIFLACWGPTQPHQRSEVSISREAMEVSTPVWGLDTGVSN